MKHNVVFSNRCRAKIEIPPNANILLIELYRDDVVVATISVDTGKMNEDGMALPEGDQYPESGIIKLAVSDYFKVVQEKLGDGA